MKPIKNKSLIDYCTGCGLCEGLKKCHVDIDDKGFWHPIEGDEKFLSEVCIANKIYSENFDNNSIWGRAKNVYLGWSADDVIRERGSSGGVLTTISKSLLEFGDVDAIIQVGANVEDPTKTDVFFSSTPEEVVERAGSRYAISHPMKVINSINKDKKYAFIGKPCDVGILRNYMELCPDLKNNIKYILSFFCMGTPSERAQERLLKGLNCTKCTSLTYRGNGWPGKTVAMDINGEKTEMDYNSSWGNILGRDLMPICRFCVDGIGEEADISCGDAWYKLDNGTPDFSEHKGRNVIFSRTEKGDELLRKLEDAHKIVLNDFSNYEEELIKIQKSQYDRRRNLLARIMAMKTFQKSYPHYPIEMLKHYARYCSMKDWIKTYLGTAKRILQGKI